MAQCKMSMLKDIDDSTDRWKVVVRVIRRWNVYQKDQPNDLFCISMMLVDAEGSRIQASIHNKQLFSHFDDKLAEGSVYFMANFVVSENNKEYRATNHPFKITIGAQTYVTLSNAIIPEYSYMFFPIADITEVTQKSTVDYLIDVIGFVTAVSLLEEYRVNNEIKNKIRLIIADEMGISVPCVLFDECAVDVCMHDFIRMEAPVVILIQLCRIGFAEDGTPEVCSSFNATKVAFNMKFPEVKNFIESAKTLPSPTVSTISATAPSQYSSGSASSLIRTHPLISIAEIPGKAGEDYFLIECLIIKLDTRHGWYYDGCGRCGSKAKVVGGKVTCTSNTCKGKNIVVETKMKLHYTVEDESGRATVVFFDKLAMQFIGKKASDMKIQLEKEARGYDFPDELEILIGKRLLLKLRLNKYNRDNPNSSISVSSYTEMVDLINEFDQAATMDADGEEEVPTIMVVPNQHVEDTTEIESHAIISDDFQQESSGLDDLPISTLISNGPSKGKRKGYGKKPAAMKEKFVTGVSISPVKTYVKPQKFIKQEKN